MKKESLDREKTARDTLRLERAAFRLCKNGEFQQLETGTAEF